MVGSNFYPGALAVSEADQAPGSLPAGPAARCCKVRTTDLALREERAAAAELLSTVVGCNEKRPVAAELLSSDERRARKVDARVLCARSALLSRIAAPLGAAMQTARAQSALAARLVAGGLGWASGLGVLVEL